MDVRELTAERERRDAVPLLRQLWDQKDRAEVLEWTGTDEYYLFGGYDDNDLVGVAGVLLSNHLHHVRHAWLYDLVVDEPRRGEGFGRGLVDHVEQWARKRDCAAVALASPLYEEETHAFYDALDYDRWGYVLERTLDD